MFDKALGVGFSVRHLVHILYRHPRSRQISSLNYLVANENAPFHPRSRTWASRRSSPILPSQPCGSMGSARPGVRSQSRRRSTAQRGRCVGVANERKEGPSYYPPLGHPCRCHSKLASAIATAPTHFKGGFATASACVADSRVREVGNCTCC